MPIAYIIIELLRYTGAISRIGIYIAVINI
jgi:hypothetical protein